MNRFTRLPLLFVAALVALPALPVSAEIEEIVVQARRRAESIQDVPIAVTAFDAQAVTETYTETIAEISRYVPNAQFADVQFNGAGLSGGIRGVSFGEVEKTYENAIGFSVDGVFLATATGGSIDVFDIESIEVLRGPQGTLFGRNTIGGTINVRRTRPTGEFGVRAGVRAGSYSQLDYSAVVNLPKLGDALSTKLFFFSNNGDVFTESQTPGVSDDGQDTVQFGATFLLEPHEDFEALLTVEYLDDDSFFPPVVNLARASDNPGSFCGIVGNIIPAALQPFFGGGTGSDAACDTASHIPARDSGFENSFPPIPFLNAIEQTAFTLEMKWDIGGGRTLASVSGYRDSEELLLVESSGSTLIDLPNAELPGALAPLTPQFLPLLALSPAEQQAAFAMISACAAPDVDCSALLGGLGGAAGFRMALHGVPVFVADRLQNFEQFSQELRLNGSTDAVEYVGGVYYLHSVYDIDGSGGHSFTEVAGAPANLRPPQVIALGGRAQTFFAEQTLDAFAVFGEATWSVSDELRLTAGGRFTLEEKEFTADYRHNWTTNPATMMGQCLPAACFLFEDDEDWSEFTWRLIAEYDLADEMMAYTSWSRGFRSGGYNGRGTSDTRLGPYDAETVDSFEAGLRSDWFGNRLRINPTVFYSLYKDKQEQIIEAGGAATDTTTLNAADATLYGAELEVFAAPTEALELRFSVGYLDTEYDEFGARLPTAPDTITDVSNLAQLLRAPEWNISAGFRYALPLGPGTLVLNGDWDYVDETITSPRTLLYGVTDGRDIIDSGSRFDFSAGYHFEEGIGVLESAQLTAFVKDAFESDAGRIAATLDVGPFFFGVLAPHRLYGVELTVNF